MVVEEIPRGVEGIGSELVRREGLFCLLGLLLLLPLPLDIVLALKGITNVLDGFEVVTDHPRLDVGLQLSWL